MSGTSHSAGQSTTAKRTLDEDTESETGAVKKQKMSKDYAAAGLKSTTHGVVYQLKLLILFLIRGLHLKYDFTLATEMVAAEKFDDIVFGYTDENGKDVCRFLQAKHKQDETKNKITLRNLLTEKDGDFSIEKYFISYCKIKENPEFKDYKLKDFTICTNINLDDNLANNFKVIIDPDKILHFGNHKGFKRYRINRNEFPEVEKIVPMLRRTSKHHKLAYMLANHVFKGECLELRDLFKAYHVVLGENVIRRVVGNNDVEVVKFRSEFINGLPELNKFRESFYEEYQRVSKTKIKENEFWKKMEEENLIISPILKEKIELHSNSPLTDPEALAESIAKAIKKANTNTVRILHRELENQDGIIKDIDRLAGYVFVKKKDENEELFYFNSKFLVESEKLPDHLKQFRTEFIKKLGDKRIEFSKIKQYKFHIANFETYEEEEFNKKLSLPDDDIDGFFESFVLSVNQPNEEKLGDIIQKEISKGKLMGNGKDFKLIDTELMASKLQEDMLHWMKQKKGSFLTNEEGNELFVKIHHKVSKLVLIGPTLVYRAKMEEFGISFRKDFIVLQNFLNSEKQIFNLISSCDDTIFSSIKVLQTLKTLNSYQKEDSYIYMRLDSLLHIWKHVMEAFRTGASNLLAIECKAKKKGAKWYKLYKSLSALLKNENDKKVILITLKDDKFAKIFKTDFSQVRPNRYKEIEDRKTHLTDLTEESQKNILKKGKVFFLGKEVSLNAVVDAESKYLLSEEVVSMLIKNDELKIGKPLIDHTHTEVEDYFIDRMLIRCVVVRSDFIIEENFLVIDEENPDRPFESCDYVKREIGSKHGSYTDIILISDSRYEFKKLHEGYRKQYNIHWLKKEKGVNDRYIYRWQQSCGDLTKLCTFIDTSERSVVKYKLNKITDVYDKVVLVAAEPGMGKSVLLSRLSLDTQNTTLSPLWIVRSNLINHSSEFSEWLETNSGTIEISVLEAVKFLYKMIFDKDVYLPGDHAVDGKVEDVMSLCLTQNNDFEIAAGSNIIKNMTGSSLLEIKLFVHFFNKGKVVLLFDGFDEISPHYNDLVVKLLKVLKDTKVKSLWLTTRPYNILRKPENQFSTFAYRLQPFLKEDQTNFLKKYWKKNLKIAEFDGEKVDIFIDELVNQFSKTTNDPDRKFTSIPLQIRMLADTLSIKFKKSPEPFWENEGALANKLDLVTLYEIFLENKLDIELKKIISNERDRKKSGALIYEMNRHLEFRISHEILAVCSIFKVDQCKKLLSTRELEKIEKLKRLISEAGKKTGVIINIVDDKPEFIHRTFAEYFTAQFIWKKFISTYGLIEFEEKIVNYIVVEMLIKDGAIQVSKFLVLIAEKYFYSSIDLSKLENKIKILLMELTNQIIDYGDKEANFHSIKLLLGIIEFFFQKQGEENCIKIERNFRFRSPLIWGNGPKIQMNNEQMRETEKYFQFGRNYLEIRKVRSEIMKNNLKISNNPSLNLLCVCAEMGYTKLAEVLEGLNTELVKQHLSQRKWSHSPLWLAAENGHLAIITFLVRRFSYNPEWMDKDGKILIEHACRESTFNVLKSCLELDIIDVRPFNDHKGVRKLPLYEVLTKGAPEVIKLLIEKTNDGIVNKFIHHKFKDALANKLDLVTLYEKFLENELDIELENLISSEHDRKKPSALIDQESKRSEFRRSHEILAVCSIFKVDQCKNVLSTEELEKVKELKKRISKAKTKTGVISKIIDGKPEFIHPTFAQYLAAQFIWKKFNSIQAKSFQKKVVQDIVIKMLIEDGVIQVSRFLALIAKKYFNSSINLSTWENKIEILLLELTNQIDNYGATKDDHFQSIKILLGIIEFFLQKQEKGNLSKIIENQSPELLCLCAEMGYTKLASALTSLNTELLKQDLSKMEWLHCPLWIAAENGHLDIMRFLVVRFSYDAEWQDVNGQDLIQSICRNAAFDILKSCLELNIVDGEPYEDPVEGVEKLPIYEAIARKASVEVIKLLIEKTDAGIVNVFLHHEFKIPVSNLMLRELFISYDKPAEIIELAFKKGIDFSFCLNDVLDKFKIANICNPLMLVNIPPFDRRNFIDRCSSYSSRYNYLCNLFPIIEQLLKAGIGYSYIDARRRRNEPPSGSTYRIVKRLNDMHKLLNEIYNLHRVSDKENNDPRQILLRLIFNYISSLGFKAMEITINPKELRILPHYQEECEHKHRIPQLISCITNYSTYIKHLESNYETDNTQNHRICVWPVPEKGTVLCNPLVHHFPIFKAVMMELFFKYYILGVDGDSNLVKCAVDQLKTHPVILLGERLIPGKFSSFQECIHKINNEIEIVEKVDEENIGREKYLNKLVKNLLCDVLLMYFHQCYTITDALDEISEKVIKIEEVFNKLLEMKNKSSSEHNNMIFNEDQILDILGLKNIACEREDLQKLVSEISDDTAGFDDLVHVWSLLDLIGQRNVLPVLKQMLKFADQSKRIFDIFEELHEGYENLIYAVQDDDINKVTSVLQNVEQDFVKAIIHGQDEHYGSPLHYAALKGQADTINIFLDHGTNPNLRLCNNFEKITHFSQAMEKMKKYPFWSDDFVNWTPLYFAVLNDHIEVVQNLIERGADVNYVLNPGQRGYSVLHISALSCGSLKIAQLLLKNGARYNVPNKKDETPLNLATCGSDVEKLLRSINELFQIVEEGERNAVNSVFEALDFVFDSWEAALNAKNTNDKTLLELTNNDAQKDIFELLSEKLRMVESRGL
ncbi:uncharacterized protein LOC135836914 [Planococcus citri]|uniref:uncharacterized protein LOC135836914 n=1 Tax=Planococcus citri TaxID=170843 RepID=UPI0031F741D5